MFVKQHHPDRCPKRRPVSSQRPKSASVPASGRPGYLSSPRTPQGVPVARTVVGPAMDASNRNTRLAGPDERRGARAFKWLLAPVLSVAVLVLLAAAAEAACGKSNRVSHRASDCLSAWWENRNGMYTYNSYHVRNMCSSLGRVVAKVDLAEEMDRTLYLDNGATRSGQTKFRIRWIYCCSDLSTLCNRSDLDRGDEGASVPDSPETGTIPDNDTPANTWLLGFGRAVASEHVDLLGAQLAGGSRPPHVMLGGYRIGFAPGPDSARPQEDPHTGSAHRQVRTGWERSRLPEAEPGKRVTRSMTGRDLLTDSSFLLAGGEDTARRWTAWRSTAPLGFAAARGTPGKGRLALWGADYARDHLLAGVALSHGSGGAGRTMDEAHGIGASLHGVHPYFRLALADRLWIWSTFGFWTGDMTLRDGAARTGPPRRWRTGLAMSMAAVGAGGTLLTADDVDGFAVSATADAYVMRIGPGAVAGPGRGGLPEAEVDRLRLGLDSARVFRLGPRHSLAASVGVGVVRDGGDGGAGTSTDLNASLRHAAPGQSTSAGVGLVHGGREYTLGWRMEPALQAMPRVGLGLQMAGREQPADDPETEYTISLGVTVVW